MAKILKCDDCGSIIQVLAEGDEKVCSDHMLAFPVQTEGEKAIVLMPGVCFDEKGHRIGYGKGFYDQYLSKKDNMIKMALAYDNQITGNIPSGEMDISYDFLVTELQTICLLEDEE